MDQEGFGIVMAKSVSKPAAPKPAAKAPKPKSATPGKPAAKALSAKLPAQAKASVAAKPDQEPILTTRNLVKRYGRVTALDHADFDLYRGEILAVIGDNGAGKSSLIKAISGAVVPDEGEIRLEGQPVQFASPQAAREAGIETVYQNLALSPALSIADNMFMGREIRKPGFMGGMFKMLDRSRMEKIAREKLTELGLMTIQNIAQPVETLSGGQRQGVAVARAAAFGSKVVIMDEPTAALGVKESRRVLELILDVKRRGLPIVLISHNMPHVFEIADRIHIHRLGKRLCVINPKDFSMSDAVAFMTGAAVPPRETMAA
jgi:fructose transport system ATP-binding protein